MIDGPDEVVLIALGSNQGDRLGHLRAGLAALCGLDGVTLECVSGVFETDYVGPGGPQDDYLNACARLRACGEPEDLLDRLQAIERERGRPADTHLQPRPLDLDLLLFGDRIVRSSRLEIPHPRARERAFVMEPLAEIAGERKFPDSGETVAAACDRIRRQRQGIRRIPERID